MTSGQGWEFAHSLMLTPSFAQFAQIKWATVSDSLRSLKTIERQWGNCSGRSEEMSDREQFAQVTQRKWAMWANRSFRSPKMSKWVNRSFFLSESLICSFLDKKRAIRSKIKWANSQPCQFVPLSTKWWVFHLVYNMVWPIGSSLSSWLWQQSFIPLAVARTFYNNFPFLSATSQDWSWLPTSAQTLVEKFVKYSVKKTAKDCKC